MEPFKYASLITTISIFTALCSVIYQSYVASNELKRVTSVITNLIAIESNVTGNSVNGKGRPKVAIGYGSCMDLFVRATDFLNFTEDIRGDSDVDQIRSEQDLLTSFAYHFQKGVAAERFVHDKQFFKSLVQKAKEHRQAEPHWCAGGNAPLAMRFAAEGANVLLGASMSKSLHERLNPDIELSDQNYLEEDDIHLVFEYQSHEKWGKFRSSRANHYILHSDMYNTEFNFFPKFDLALTKFKPRLMIVSGLQVLESPLYAKSREFQINQIQNQLRNLSHSTLVHFEMGSYSESTLLDQILDFIIPHTDSIGMNEQELDTLRNFLEKGIISSVSDNNPLVTTTLDHLRAVFVNLYDRNHGKSTVKVTRLHLHTLSYHTIMTVTSFGWHNTQQSAAKASIRAFKHVCGTEILNPGSISILLENEFVSSHKLPNRKIKMKDNESVSCWKEILKTGYEPVEVEFCVVPNLICRNAIQTKGTGGSVTAAGLILQI